MQATTWKEIKSFHYCWGLLNVSSLFFPPPHRLQNKVKHIFMELDSRTSSSTKQSRAHFYGAGLRRDWGRSSLSSRYWPESHRRSAVDARRVACSAPCRAGLALSCWLQGSRAGLSPAPQRCHCHYLRCGNLYCVKEGHGFFSSWVFGKSLFWASFLWRIMFFTGSCKPPTCFWVLEIAGEVMPWAIISASGEPVACRVHMHVSSEVAGWLTIHLTYQGQQHSRQEPQTAWRASKKNVAFAICNESCGSSLWWTSISKFHVWVLTHFQKSCGG